MERSLEGEMMPLSSIGGLDPSTCRWRWRLKASFLECKRCHFPQRDCWIGRKQGDSHGKLQGQCCPVAPVSLHLVVQVTSDVVLHTSCFPFTRETYCLTSSFLLFCNRVTNMPLKDLINALTHCDFAFSWPRHFYNTHL